MIQICSRNTVAQIIESNRQVKAVISINDSSENNLPELINSSLDVLFLTFDDIESIDEFPKGILFNSVLAKSILSFSKKHQDILLSESEVFLIHCHGGVSRSAAVSAALSFIFCGQDSWIFEDSRFCPNRLVYKLLLKVSDKSQKLNDIDEKFEKNLKLWLAENLPLI